jgi:acetolactate synthase-1/2/3 large subunit
LLFSLETSSIKFVPRRHEQGAAFIAHVWGRLTGEAGVCLSTLGPGATNLMTGVADANLDKAPLLAITAQGGLDRLHHKSHQRLDILMCAPITTWNGAVYDPRVVPEIIRNAFKLAELEKPGATHIELSEDIARLDVSDDLESLPRRPVPRPEPDHLAVEEVLSLLRRAKRPPIIAGNGAIRERASHELGSAGLPTARVSPSSPPSWAKAQSRTVRRPRSSASVLGSETMFEERSKPLTSLSPSATISLNTRPIGWNPKADKTIVHIDVAPAEVYGRYPASVEVVADIAATIRALNAGLSVAPARFEQGWYAPVRQRIVDDIASYQLRAMPFTVPGALDIIRRALPDDGLRISDLGSHKTWIARNFPTYCPNGCIISNGLAAMEIALPGGIAAALARPGCAIVAAMGDGGFLMNSQELERTKRLGVGFTVAVFNDNDYGLISWQQDMSRGRSMGTRLTDPDLKAHAESSGIRADRPSTVEELSATMFDAVRPRELRVMRFPSIPA